MTPARLVIVTCANRGMGLEVVGQLARRAARFGVIDRSVERSPCALRSDRPKHRRASLRASVSSDRRAQHGCRLSRPARQPRPVEYRCVDLDPSRLARQCGRLRSH